MADQILTYMNNQDEYEKAGASLKEIIIKKFIFSDNVSTIYNDLKHTLKSKDMRKKTSSV